MCLLFAISSGSETLSSPRWVSAPAQVVQSPAAGGGDAAAPEEEQTEFTVTLTAVGDSKINVIKAVRELTQLGLKGGEGPRRRRAEAGPGERLEGRRREGGREAEGSRSDRGAEVAGLSFRG